MIDPNRTARDWKETLPYPETCYVCGAKYERRRINGKRSRTGMCDDCYTVYWRKWRYGLSGDEVVALLEAQERKCAICQDRLDIHRFHVDHDRATAKVRGLLCRFCNNGLGMFRDNAISLERAASYLRKHVADTS